VAVQSNGIPLRNTLSVRPQRQQIRLAMRIRAA
jgi:hypothetical protein